ncbi:DNA-binding transcriptional MerR regulator [Melghiribacillus thermohalophilus]|uniref:DNA-binding transcriptional MerR regulator n=1 Tax=Melghiribacillus thermohalophilus TaxID=1324956 RepID=A0A4R3MUG7_9BACI|nr:MerR family transcriptional regulator [Melghiribacillus thermohalophilus]TCT19387.1 DNA-binding transcriptional MerR regulator [Melghiribacillus thermohalophilus]
MRIGELSRLTGASVRSLRHYEQKGLIFSERQENGYRSFENAMVQRVKTIQLFLGLGLNTDQIKEIIDCKYGNQNAEHNEFCEELYQKYEEKRNEINVQIQHLKQVKERLEEKMNEFHRHEGK